jgi:hypothetical protein
MINKNPVQPTNPQPVFTAEESSWQDLGRIATFIVTLGFGFVIASIYLVFFLLYINNKFSPTNPSKVVGILMLVTGFIVLIVPILLEFIGLRVVSGFAKRFTESFYNISGEVDVAHLIQRRVFGVPPMPGFLSTIITYPFIVVDKDKLDNKFSWAYSLGGPAKLIVYDGFAVYLERGDIPRVVGSGIAFLERYETIKDIIDLRPQIKEIATDAWTKDGIKLTIHIRLECQIQFANDTELPQESEKRNYPFYDKAIQAAVETAAVRLDKDGQPEKYDWVAGVCGNTEGHIRMHVYGNTINHLLRGETGNPTKPEATAQQQFPEDNKEKTPTQLLSTDLRDLILGRVNKDIERLGARLINLQIVKVDKSLVVDQQWAENWSAEWKSLNTIMTGEAEAYKIRTLEKAHADAQKDMILAIAGSLENMDEQEMREPLLLSLSSMLENSLVDPYVRAALPRETMETLEKLQNYLQEEN